MKQYLVVRMSHDLSDKAGIAWLPVPGLFTFEAAEHFVESAKEEDPEGEFLIQEVGRA